MIKLKRLLMKRGLKLIAAIFLASLTAITLTTCGGGGGSGDGGGGGSSGGGSNSGGGGGGSSTSSVIGTSGGSVTLNDATVNIPANLLSQDAKVTLTEISPSALQIDNSLVLGTPVQITIEPVSASSTSASSLSASSAVQIKSLWGLDVKQSISIYWNNVDEAKAAISAGICMATKIVTPAVGPVGQKILSIPCKISNSTAVATEVLYLQWANTTMQKFVGTYGLFSNQIREFNRLPSLKSFTLTDSNQQGESREFDNSPLNGRTPVILIHGINREENLGRDCPLNNSDKERFWCYEYKRNVWNTFYKEAAKIAGFYNRFKIYEYVYPSFKSSALDNGPSLSSLIQNDLELANSKIFLVAHSYGGLVARQAMNANNGVLGSQTINLFTLATPHHGSIGASLLNLMPGTLNDPVGDAFLLDTKTLIAINLAKAYYGAAVYTQGYTDLQWDNFDNGIPQHYTNNFNVFTNGLLKTFNEGRDNFKGKIITYSGGNLGVLDPTVVNDILNSSDISDALGKIPDTISRDRVMLYFAAETIKRFGDYNDDSNPPNYPDSDGMVPRSSANFEAGGVTKGLVLDDVDHEQIFDNVRVINNIQNRMLSTYIDSGTYTYNSATGALTLNTTSSNSVCGLTTGTENFTVTTLTSTTMTWVSSYGDSVTWTRPSGTAGDIVGTWTWSFFSDPWAVLTFNSNNTFSLTVNCKVAIAYSVHTIYLGTDYYSADFNVSDPTGQYTSVTVTGQGITGSLNLTYDATNGYGYWQGWISFGSTPPTTPLTYTFTLNSSTGATVLTDDIESFVPVATNLSPSGTGVSATPTFSWTGAGTGYTYLVSVWDSNCTSYPCYSMWYSGFLTTTSVAYAGPPLASGATYNYSVIMYDTYLNMSWSESVSFVVQ